MRYNALAVMALVNGLAQANRFDWQSESKVDVAKHHHKSPTDPVFKVEVKEEHQAVDKDQLDADINKKKDEDERVELVVEGAKHGSQGNVEAKVYTPAEVEKLKMEKGKAEEERREAKKLEKLEGKKLEKLEGKKLEKLEDKLKKKKEELEAAETGGRRHHHSSHSSSSDPTYTSYGNPTVTTTTTYYHHTTHSHKGPYTLDGETFDYIHKPKLHHHTSYTTHEPSLSPDCVGDRCGRKPCNKCDGNWAQPGCWHCKNHESPGEEAAEAVAKTFEHASKKTKVKDDANAMTYTYGDKTVIVPKETKAPEAPQVEEPHKARPKVIVVEQPKKESKEEKKYEEEKEGEKEGEKEEEKKYEEKPKHKYPEEKPKHKYLKEEHKHEYPKEEHKKENICDKVQHNGEPSICDKLKHQHKPELHKVHEPKKEDICDKVKGCHSHGEAPAPHYHEVKPAPAPDPAPEPAPNYHEHKPKPAPAPALPPQYPEKKPEEINPAPVPAPAPAPAPAPNLEVKPEEVRPVPVPAPAPGQPERKSGEARPVPVPAPA
ncbi:hypothetical protein F53441_12764, partial [Fusarium austroafricanum]